MLHEPPVLTARERNSVYATVPLCSPLAGNGTSWNTARGRASFFSLPSRSSGYGCSAYAQVNHFQLLTSPPYTAPRGQDVQQITSQPHTIHAPVEDVSKVLKYYALRSIYRSLSLVAVGIHVRE